METNNSEFENNIAQLKEARLQLLQIHKLLVDSEREVYEKNNGSITSGQYLGLLLNDPNLMWLRKFSALIVEIDEMMDLDDGYTQNMIDKQLDQMKALLNFNSGDEEFNGKYQAYLQNNSEIVARHSELKKLLLQ